ncbi:MAG TPA: TrpB-like pyridoxal phosphate-dependent enzyme [Candidatus Baltobacteraceae bacterium]|nr:TrpB-like pyridoxal phosphate-dependent enzyme [Candidatus Baltobacteraceae bacterium]
MSDTKTVLTEKDLPAAWYNLQADLPFPLPPVIHPGTLQPIGPDDLAPIFPMGLIQQEVSRERYIPIPEPVRDIYRLWRPTPLYRAHRLERALQTPARIYYKWEGVSPAGSHKPNTAVAQAYYNKQEQVVRLTTETGAGQWGSALALACRQFGMECKVYMVRISYEQKPYRKLLMAAWGATVVPSPSPDTEAGRAILAKDPNSPGSLGIAISEAVEDATKRPDTKYALGSVLNHVLLHQTVIGLETKRQFELLGEYPDVLVGCVGGGSSFGGFTFPFVQDKLGGKSPNLRIIAVEPTACPSLTKGRYIYDFGDTAGTTPLMKMYTLGHSFVPAPIHAGGLRYHGMAPLICVLYDQKVIEAVALPQNPVFEAALQFAQTEGIVPAPEPSHAIRVVIDEALRCRERGERKTIAFVLCGHGYFDLSSYERYMAGQLEDLELPQSAIDEALSLVPKVE